MIDADAHTGLPATVDPPDAPEARPEVAGATGPVPGVPAEVALPEERVRRPPRVVVEPEPERLVLSDAEVDELVELLCLHLISGRNPRYCTCGEGWKCARRRLAEARLFQARRGADIWRAVAVPPSSRAALTDKRTTDSPE